MTFTEVQRSHLERLRKKYRIEFKHEVTPSSLTPEQSRLFQDICKLAETKYDSYAVDQSFDPSAAPWKIEAKKLALRLAERAYRCRCRNEASWRHACEPLVFARVDSDVACPRCRQRLWRSEIEAITEKDSYLEKRQERRQPCRCPRSSRPADVEEAKGVSRIFNHREEEDFNYPSPIKEEIGKTDRPDRAYGLRETRNFDDALQSPICTGPSQVRTDQGQKRVIETIDVSPYSLSYPDPLLFPFLFLEAKSGKSTDDWHSIELQTCFPIRTALSIQSGLQRANGANSRWNAGPLVWFLMSRGEDWKLCFAVINDHKQLHHANNNFTCSIFEVWSGSIVTKDGSLQLLLLVDYIFDWARDVYRPSILEELRLLSPITNAVGPQPSDSDIFSTKDLSISLNETESTTNIAVKDISDKMDAFCSLDSSWGMVRHAALVSSRYRALFITSDNVNTLLRSMKTNVAQILARQILRYIANGPLGLDLTALNGIEEQWTGNKRLRPHPLMQTKFYAVITFAAYMDPLWKPVRELNVVAVAEDAFGLLVEYSNLRPGKGKAARPVPHPVTNSQARMALSKIQGQPRTATLMAAIIRTQRRLRWHIDQNGWVFYLEKEYGTIRDVVQYMYNYFQKGEFEPSEPFLRVSSRFKKIASGYDRSPLLFEPFLRVSSRFKKVVNGSAWTPVQFEDLEDTDVDAVLIYGRGRVHDRQRTEQSDVCIFLLDDPVEIPDTAKLANLLKNTYEHDGVYHTTRDNGTSNINTVSNLKNKPPWNLNNTYGVYTRGPEFIRWIVHLRSSPPTRQNSLDGSYFPLLDWNIAPWSDPRYTGQSWQSFYFLCGLMTLEMSHWKRENRKNEQRDYRFCQCCLEDQDKRLGKVISKCERLPYVCGDCDKYLKAQGFPFWVVRAMSKEDITQYEYQEEMESDDSHDSDDTYGGSESDDTGDGFTLGPVRRRLWHGKILQISPRMMEGHKDLVELFDKSLRFGNMMREKKLQSHTRKRKRKRSSSSPFSPRYEYGL